MLTESGRIRWRKRIRRDSATPEDAEAEARLMPNAEFRPIESVWGHRAGNPTTNATDHTFIRKAVEDLTA